MPDERDVEETSCVDTLGGLLDHAAERGSAPVRGVTAN